MSKYTTMLRFPIEQKLSDLGLENLESNWKQTYNFLGLDDYPIFDELYRETLNNKIIRRYYFREIGFETFGQFKWILRRTMFEIMPYYNQLYNSQDLITDPLKSFSEVYEGTWDSASAVNSKTDNTNTTNNESTSESNGTTTDRNIFQDTPMSMLDTSPSAVENLEYATTVTYDNGTSTDNTKNNSTSNSVTNSNLNRTDNRNGNNDHTLEGYRESQSKLLLEYRKTFINIDLEIVEELNDLFIGLW